MNTRALLLLCLLSTSAFAEPRRGWLSGVGFGLLTAGAAAAGVGVSQALVANDSNIRLALYAPLRANESAGSDALIARRTAAKDLMTPMFVSAGVAVALGAVLVVLDGFFGTGSSSPVSIGVAPVNGGAFASLSIRY